ncbi:hypothetical protein TVAG_185680 [Trichomonas vaginalis G3]|uniref:Meckelin n=1 Tax=Trichomonas vaginalis (strain ATCC PRA-98 / G3) TaxID=412133 RepID=A2D8L2_TRIV3|nr:Meckel-Gruber Syndrome (MKS)-like protein family [Trichomonas vaginalis G3]EAY23261.1 hypothetical protein TVAG_185680 [Trichomonas vaginalis G3]KAI5534090.1 Meckel-Gruber Syndrome (MKS)-like protein family [Trichomonas vaginalis G3]|eukprot:XP_001584247.1 hypothetical protein [Trichomonas vaginalis G3]
MFLIYTAFATAVGNMPILSTTCGEGKIYDPFNYSCEDCPSGSSYNSTTQTCEYSSCEDGYDRYESACIKTDTYERIYTTIANQETDLLTFTNPKTTDTSTTVLNLQYSDETFKKILYYGVIAKSSPYDVKAKEFFANLCTANHFKPDSAVCNLFRFGCNETGDSQYGYEYWRKGVPFLYYNGTQSEIVDEDIFKSTYPPKRDISIQLARYSPDGDFLGFKELTIDFERCSIKNSNAQIWRSFGSNLYNDCYINLYEELNKTSQEFYEPFIVDNTVDGEQVIRPLPALDLNYASTTSQSLNRQDERYHVLTRRFFLAENYTSNDYIQYLTNFTLVFETRMRNKTYMYVPYVAVDYIQVLKSSLKERSPSFKPLTEEIYQPHYEFNVEYTMDLSDFWNGVLATIIVFLFLLVVALVWRLITFCKRHNAEGLSSYIMLGSFAYILDYISNWFFVCFFLISTYYWFFYKLQYSTFYSFPYSKEFPYLIPFVWTAFVVKFFAVLLRLWQITTTDLFFIDWETPHSDDKTVSSWRRITVAKEWLRVTLVHSYSIPFTLITIVFIQNGFNVDLISQAIPDTLLKDVGFSPMVLRVGWLTFLWVILGFVQWIWCEFFYWHFGSDPFLNVVDLCSTSNISTMVIESPQHGYYVHGRCVHAHADESMFRLTTNLAKEALGVASGRGLTPEDKSQVYEVFYEKSFRLKFIEVFYSVMNNTGSKLFKVNASEIPHACIDAFSELNKLFTRFFDMSQSEHRAEVQLEVPITQYVFGLSPKIEDRSILSKDDDREFRKTMIHGAQWSLYILAIILFVGVDMHTHNSMIAAFVVFIVDFLITFVFKMRARAKIAKNALIDTDYLM